LRSIGCGPPAAVGVGVAEAEDDDMEAVEDILHEVSMSRSQREGGKGEWKIVANLMKRVVKLID